jgi:hypothetical protein
MATTSFSMQAVVLSLMAKANGQLDKMWELDEASMTRDESKDSYVSLSLSFLSRALSLSLSLCLPCSLD